ncbi:(2Fe-2S)-binding protein [Saccharothrix australiensis]|uniref:FhuF-like iron-sulfur protein n=1 Tax=Saccharothrix australiensis TaxID=2072 RepID=A0A495VS37_9PSEU|nr:(2Fe-2S)-binding protein [Saccharothrix australiensis]RKT52181.1 FhuF-like iron-sulfur protein [Saccharothrix australiensis]
MTVPVQAPARDARTPIAGSVTRADALAQWCEVRYGLPRTAGEPGAGTGWVVTEAFMTDPDRFGAWRATLADWLRAQYGAAPDRTTGGYVMSWYLGAVGLLGGALFHQSRRVPSLRPSDVAIHVAEHDRPHVVGLAVLADGFACLPDDPDADHPAATVVADDHALAALLRARFAAHASRFVASFGPTVRFGRRQLWAAATDALDSAAWTAGLLAGDEAAGVADSALLLPAKQDPFTSGSTLRATDAGWTRRRESCCFHFALPAAEACATCPRVCRDEAAGPAA